MGGFTIAAAEELLSLSAQDRDVLEVLEDYPDVGQVQGRVIEVGDNSPEAVTQVRRVE